LTDIIRGFESTQLDAGAQRGGKPRRLGQ
jgi:hypothetical protein